MEVWQGDTWAEYRVESGLSLGLGTARPPGAYILDWLKISEGDRAGRVNGFNGLRTIRHGEPTKELEHT